MPDLHMATRGRFHADIRSGQEALSASAYREMATLSAALTSIGGLAELPVIGVRISTETRRTFSTDGFLIDLTALAVLGGLLEFVHWVCN